MSRSVSSKGELPGLAQLRLALREKMPFLRERYKVRALGLWGSYVRDALKPRIGQRILNDVVSV
jgi:predicted nucleotidyltransferase